MVLVGMVCGDEAALMRPNRIGVQLPRARCSSFLGLTQLHACAPMWLAQTHATAFSAQLESVGAQVE
jgi:hypothetical protein